MDKTKAKARYAPTYKTAGKSATMIVFTAAVVTYHLHAGNGHLGTLHQSLNYLY